MTTPSPFLVPARVASTRRTFLGGAAALTAAGAVPGLWPRPARAEPKRGGTIRAAKGHGQSTDTLDPGSFINGYMTALAYGVHGYLTGVDVDGQIEPQLAESWEASADAKVWRFKIRQGVTFHDGKPLTLEDVVASVNHHRGEKTTSAAAPLFAGVVNITIEGKDTVAFELATGNADFPFVFADYHLGIMPADGEGVDWRSGNGCGPYRLLEFKPGVISRLERFQNDWTQERGYFDAVEMLSVLDLNARTTALVSGEVDTIDKLDLKTVGLLGRKPGVEIASIAGPQFYSFAMLCDMDPFTDRNVRLALKYGINRQELVDKILFGHGTVGNDQPIGPSYRYFDPNLEQRTYDPDRAKFHLKEAGLDSVAVTLSAADAAFPGAVDAATLFQASAKPAGIDLTVNRVPNDGYWADVWLKAPFSAVYWGGRPTEDQILTTEFESGQAWNDSRWSNARFDELLVKARGELDDARRREMYGEMQALVREDAGVILPMFSNFVFANSAKIGHGKFASNYDVDGERWMERWWFI